jgi:hypothetical protein
MSHERTHTPTLDRERTDLLRTFLTVEAAADVASVAPSWPHGRRRWVAGIAAAFLLGTGMFAANAVAGGPGPAPVRSANALSIESNDGWTTVRIEDIDADPQAVLDELHAAGIKAGLDHLTVGADGHTVTVGSGAGTAGVVGMVGSRHGDRGLVGLSVSLPAGVEPPAIPAGAGTSAIGGSSSAGVVASSGDSGDSGGAGGPSAQVSGDAPPAPAGDQDQFESLGVRFGADGSVSIRNGSDNRVVVYVQ